MNNHVDIFNQSNLGFAAIFGFMCLGFFFLGNVDREEKAVRVWAISFALNGIGFLFWSNTFTANPALIYLAGEIFHMAGFITLVFGAYRFFGKGFDKNALIAVSACALSWIVAISFSRRKPDLMLFLLRLIRALIFMFAAGMIMRQERGKRIIGKDISAISMLLWGAYILVTAVWRVVKSSDLQFGILTGLHILAAFGLVAMVVDRIKRKAEESEEHVRKLEGLLPICSYCKKIRDGKNEWQVLERFIEDRSSAEFSHGICPDCLRKHYGEFDVREKS